MLKKIKEKIMSLFLRKATEVNKDYTSATSDKYIDVIGSQEIVQAKQITKEDINIKLQKKLQLIARNTKSARIRNKNIKRLSNLFGDF